MSETKPIEMTTTEPSIIDREAFPLTVGLPFAKGALPDGAPLSMADASGKPVALQTRVMEQHDDSSTRWMLLDYQADLSAGEKTVHQLTVAQEGKAPAGPSIETKQQGDTLIVDNGVLKLELDTKRCRPLDRVWLDGQRISPADSAGLDFTVTDENGLTFSARNDASPRFEIEEQGTQRLLVSWEGDHQDDTGQSHLGFFVRLAVYAGKPFVRVDHVFTNRMDPEEALVKSIVARLPIDAGDKPSYAVADTDENQGHAQLVSDQPLRLQQFHVRNFKILDSAGKMLENRSPVRARWQHSKGWADLSGADRGVLLAAKDFWQNYPKVLAVNGDAIEYHLVPEQPASIEMPNPDRSDFFGDMGPPSCLLGKPFPIPRGMAKTHTFHLHFHQGRQEARQREQMSLVLREWPMPVADSHYYHQTGELWDYFPYEPKKYPRLETALRKLFYEENMFHKIARESSCKAFGLRHFGDFLLYFFEGSNDPDAPDVYYLNNEYDTAHVYAMMFLRHREIAQWWAAESIALHTMDIDTCHHAVEMEHMPDIRFMQFCQYSHCIQHVGGAQRVGDTQQRHAHGSHTFLQGVIDYYHLTGDRRARDIAVKTATGLGHMCQFYDWDLERNTGWGMLVVGSGYAIEPNEEMRKGAEAVLDRLYDKLNLGPDGTGDPFAGELISDRSVNLGMRGLIRWHQVTGDERCRKLIMAIMESYVKRGFLEEGLPYAGSTPDARYPTVASQGFANLESLAYAYRLTGDRKFIEAGHGALCQAVNWMNDPENDGTFSSRMLRGPFPFMAIAHEMGILEKVPGASRWLND